MTTQESPTSTILTSGNWTEHTAWEFHVTDAMPERSICTAVFCLALADDSVDSIVLTRTARGWELPGGHIEPGETIEQALVRESQEEGGFIPDWYRLFGYRKITSSVPVANAQHGGYYPPVSYIPYFVARTNHELAEHTGDEVLDCATFNINLLPDIDATHRIIIEAGINAYTNYRPA